jgi:hypothetical protein
MVPAISKIKKDRSIQWLWIGKIIKKREELPEG